MKYQHTQVFQAWGVMIPAEQGDKELVIDEARGLRAILTSCPDELTLDADRNRVIAVLILTGVIGSQDPAAITEAVSAKLGELRDSRKQASGGSAFLVISVTGEVGDFEPSPQKELDEFVLGFDGPSTAAIRDASESLTTAVIAAMSLELESLAGIAKLSDTTVFFRNDGKPVYAYSASLGAASVLLSLPPSDEAVALIGAWYPKLVANSSLARVIRLLASSYESGGDRLRFFIAAWTALEMFVSKTFQQYERLLFNELRLEGRPAAHDQFLERIQGVMKDKYRLWDKFAVIACQLSPSDADADVETFKSAKDMRDDMSHGQDIDEAALPLNAVQNLLRKYLRLHLGPAGRKSPNSLG
jgi:hypothetical protein